MHAVPQVCVSSPPPCLCGQQLPVLVLVDASVLFLSGLQQFAGRCCVPHPTSCLALALLIFQHTLLPLVTTAPAAADTQLCVLAKPNAECLRALRAW